MPCGGRWFCCCRPDRAIRWAASTQQSGPGGKGVLRAALFCSRRHGQPGVRCLRRQSWPPGRVFVCPQAASLEALDAWSELRTVLAVETIRGVNGSGKIEAEIRYFLSSCHDDPTGLVQAIRRPWTIENGLHWILDVTFREDDSRVRDRTAARGLAILRKIAINLVGRSRTTRISMRARRKQAAWNDEYMLALLAG